jgi:hypothetical protein
LQTCSELCEAVEEAGLISGKRQERLAVIDCMDSRRRMIVDPS